jgi:hypothetical protein
MTHSAIASVAMGFLIGMARKEWSRRRTLHDGIDHTGRITPPLSTSQASIHPTSNR